MFPFVWHNLRHESPALTAVLQAQRNNYSHQHHDVGDQFASHHTVHIVPQHIDGVRVMRHRYTATFQTFAQHTKARLSDIESSSKKCVSGV